MFDRFDSQWNKIDQSQYEPGVRNDYILNHLQDVSEDIVIFCLAELQKHIVRDDYKELLELTLIFLGIDYFPRNVRFRTPGARHYARWMSKALYALKIFMFLKVFSVSPRDKTALAHFCLFVVRFYVEAWTQCTNAMKAPQQDLIFLKKIHAFAEVDKQSLAHIYGTWEMKQSHWHFLMILFQLKKNVKCVKRFGINRQKTNPPMSSNLIFHILY